ncbi:MAG: GGDEF domain-containing protein [Nitriliruptoraceae bacterium]
MPRPSSLTRARRILATAAKHLNSPVRRVAAFGGSLVLTLAGHTVLGTQIAWLAAPIILLAGVSAGLRAAMTVAVIAIAGHTFLDLVDDRSVLQLPGYAVRAITLLMVGVIGAAGAQIERQREQAMQRSVTEDPVTGLLNVRAFYDELRALRHAATPFVILLADIRGMRALNDRYGHPTGTEAMRALAHVLRRSVGPDVLASRLGSDELAIALVNADQERCRSTVQRIIERLHDELVTLPDGERFEVHASYGIARFPEDGHDEIAVLRAADRAKDHAKSAGMDRLGTANGDVL